MYVCVWTLRARTRIFTDTNHGAHCTLLMFIHNTYPLLFILFFLWNFCFHGYPICFGIWLAGMQSRVWHSWCWTQHSWTTRQYAIGWLAAAILAAWIHDFSSTAEAYIIHEQRIEIGFLFEIRWLEKNKKKNTFSMYSPYVFFLRVADDGGQRTCRRKPKWIDFSSGMFSRTMKSTSVISV